MQKIRKGTQISIKIMKDLFAFLIIKIIRQEIKKTILTDLQIPDRINIPRRQRYTFSGEYGIK
jgi:hypothetical protein